MRQVEPRYIGPFVVFERVGEVAYKLALLPSLSTLPPMFHVYLLKRYVSNQSHQSTYEELELHPDLTNEEVVRILDRYS